MVMDSDGSDDNDGVCDVDDGDDDLPGHLYDDGVAVSAASATTSAAAATRHITGLGS